ncbi:L-2-hydroxyglutarate oxidase [Spongiibacter sp.]|uniref:L-2-hydroxyglutarate oxidase n=1 Tax=Spongiibacter sp. TaxID=2024860 RepID=UPI00356661CA
MSRRYDVIVVGCGIVGAASAWQILQRWPDCRLLMLEKESAPARHQSGRNSGVVHAGVYYPAASLKARMCRQGLRQTRNFCESRALPFRQCGKWIVAASEGQLPGLALLQQLAVANGLAPQYLTQGAMREQEPALAGVAALAVAESAIVDYAAICRQLLAEVQAAGGDICYGAEVTAIDERTDEMVLQTRAGDYSSALLLACAGLMSDRLARLQGLDCDFRIVPFRGEFYRLAPRCESWLSRLVYPVPDPSLPFLGVHLTPLINGGVVAGPNAVLALAREGYRRRDVDVVTLLELLGFAGFWRLLARHGAAGLDELRSSLSKRRYLEQLQQYCPALEVGDLMSAPAGVRAQAVSRRGDLLQDFVFLSSRRSVHVGNAPSPAATSALPIGEHIAQLILQRR